MLQLGSCVIPSQKSVLIGHPLCPLWASNQCNPQVIPAHIRGRKMLFVNMSPYLPWHYNQQKAGSLAYQICIPRVSLVAQTVKNLPTMWETWVQSLGWEDSLEEGMATHSSILAWRIPHTEEKPHGRLQSMGSQRVGHDWTTKLNWRTSLVARTVKHLFTMWETWVQSLVWEDSLEKEMAVHSSTLA